MYPGSNIHGMLLRLYPVAYVHDWYMTSTVDILCGRGGTRLGTLYCLRGVSRIEVAISALQIVWSRRDVRMDASVKGMGWWMECECLRSFLFQANVSSIFQPDC